MCSQAGGKVAGSTRVIDQLSDGSTNIRTLVSGEGKPFRISFSLRQFVDLLAYYLQHKDELAAVLLCDTTGYRKLRPKTADFGRYNQFSDFAHAEAGEQYQIW